MLRWLRLATTTLALATLLSTGCKSNARLEGCEDDPTRYTLVTVSGDLGRLGACALHREQFSLGLRVRVPEGTRLALGNDPWVADANGIHWLDLRPWLLDLPPYVARRWAEAVEGPIAIPLEIAENGASRRGEIRLEVGSLKWSELLASVASGYRFPRAAADAPPNTLVYLPGSVDDPYYLGQAERLRDLGLVAVSQVEETSSDTCGPYSPVDVGAGLPFTVTRTFHRRTVTVYDPHTGERVAEQAFEEHDTPCPASTTEGARLRVEPDREQILAWLETVRASRGATTD
jgi:hypothetical protein